MSWPSPSVGSRRSRRTASMLPLSLSAFGIAGSVCVIGALFFARGQALMREQLRERLKSTAAAAAMQFDAAAIDAIRAPEDMATSTFRDVVSRLDGIRQNVAYIRYAYVMRRTDDPNVLSFVADADALKSETELDRNGNGAVDADEEPSLLGDAYDATDVPALRDSAFLMPAVDEAVTVDQWGQLISGYAPIRSENGRVVAVLGIDMDAAEYIRLSQNLFSPVMLLLVMLAAVTIGSAVIVLGARRRVEDLRRIEIERAGLLRLTFHQIGGPLSIIKWSLELLRDSITSSDRRVLDNMEEGVKRLSGILQTLHEADMVHAGNVPYRAEQASLHRIVRSVAEEFAEVLARRKQRVTLELGDDITMRLDPTLIAGVIRELLNNSTDFSYDAGQIVIRASRRNGDAQIEIVDHGCGIPKRDLPRIFDEFERGSNAAKFKPDGSGLGLYIVRGIVERAGGSIRVQSAEGKGTTVTLSLPIAE